MMDTSQMELIPLLETLNHKEYDLVELDTSVLEEVKMLTIRTMHSYKSQGRTFQRKRSNVFFGKLAEYAFKQKFGDAVTDVYTGNTYDEGYDFIFKNSGKKIDVKFFGYDTYHSMVSVSYTATKSDYYAAFRKIYIGVDKAVLDFYGFYDIKEFLKNDKSKGTHYLFQNFFYIPCSKFKNIEIC